MAATSPQQPTTDDGGIRPLLEPDPGSEVAPGDRIALKGMRGVIAQRMHQSLQESAQLTLTTDVEMDRCVEMRGQLSEIGADELGAVPGYTDFVIAAAARALRRFPIVNSSIVGDEVVVGDQVNVGMAVAVPGGLMVPVIHDADRLGLIDLAVRTRGLATAAREGQLALDQVQGGTFSVTALGMFGVEMFTPVINPPNAAILGVGRIRDDVGWVGEEARRVKRMTLSLTWDHRIVDGAPAAQFAQAIARFLEAPLRLL